MDSLYKELRRRNVFRVAAVYAVVGWLLAQVAAIAFPAFEAPSWVLKSVIALIISGFPIAVILAWAFELTPDGVKRTVAVQPGESITHRTGEKLDFALLAGLVILVAVTIGDRVLPQQFATQGPPVTAAEAASADIDDKSIAVLPFADMSPDRDQEYFADGLSEELLNVLAQIDDLKVAGRTSSFAFKGDNRDLREIGEMLNVAHVLEGSVRKSGDRIRVTAQLVKTADGYHVFSDTYEGSLDDVFKVQDDIAGKILTSMKSEILGEPEAEQAAPRNFAAYDLYLLARQKVYTRDRVALDDALNLLDEATEIDPDYAPAWALKAMTVLHLSDGRGAYGDIPVADALERAAPMIEKSLALDPNLAEGHAALGMLRLTAFAPYEEAEPPLRRALEINPVMADANNWLAIAMSRDGRIDEAEAIYEGMFDRDPLYRPAYANLIRGYTMKERFAEAEAVIDRIQKIEGRSVGLINARTELYQKQGRLADAIKLIDSLPRDAWENTTRRYYTELNRQIGEYEKASRFAEPVNRVLLYALMDDVDAARDQLQNLPAPDRGDVTTLAQAVYAMQFFGTPGEVIAYVETTYNDLPTLARTAPTSPIDWAPEMAYAYRRAGNPAREQEATALARATVETFRAQGIENKNVHFAAAQLAALDGDTETALAELTAALETQMIDASGFPEPVFDGLRADPEFRQIEARMLGRVNAERDKLNLPPLTELRVGRG